MTSHAAELTQDDLDKFSGSKVLFGHQSVGSNILYGISALFDGRESSPRILETRDAIGDGRPFCAHTHIGSNGDPQAKLDDFAAIIGGPLGAESEVALLKLCYADIVAATDVPAVFEQYARIMTRLEDQRPATKFLYTTVPITTDRSWKTKVKALLGGGNQMGPADNIARRRYNDLVRDRYGASGRLFDIAAVESARSRATNRTHDGERYVVLHPDLASDAGHLNERGARAAATELVRVIARS